MRRWDDERDGESRREPDPAPRAEARDARAGEDPRAADARDLPGANRTREERARNQRKEVNEERKGDDRRPVPYASEQRMMGLLAELGERYRIDYQREYKIRDERNDWFVTHVDCAWPKERLVIEVYGGVHRERFFDPEGTRAEDERQRIDDVRACGWRVLIVHDTEMSRKRWRTAVAKVETFLNEGRGGGSR